MNAHPSASPTALLVRDDLPDLDRLAQLACQTGGVPAALLVEWTLPQPQVLGRHGLDPHQADLALQACLQAIRDADPTPARVIHLSPQGAPQHTRGSGQQMQLSFIHILGDRPWASQTK